MEGKTITGHELWNDTKLGKDLQKYLPSNIRRIVIDIQPDEPVRMFIDCHPQADILTSNWDEIFGRIKIINFMEVIKLAKENAKHFEDAHTNSVKKQIELIKENAELRRQIKQLKKCLKKSE